MRELNHRFGISIFCDSYVVAMTCQFFTLLMGDELCSYKKMLE